MAQIINGRRGGKILVHEGYIYQRNQTSGDYIYRRCASKDCRAPLKTDAFDVAEPPNSFDAYDVGQHNHASSDEVIRQQLLINEMKENIRDDPSAPLRRVYDQSVVVARRRENAPPAEEIPLFHQVASQLKRTKYKNVPPVPNDVEDVEINDVWRLTWEGDDYIAHQDNDWGILIFATEHNLRFLNRHGRIIFVDGTFRSCPHPYNQIFTVHALVQDHVVVLVICLMVNRDIGSYRQVFQVLKNKILEPSPMESNPEIPFSESVQKFS